MRLNSGARALEGYTLNDIGVQGALQQEVHIPTAFLHDPFRLPLEDLDERVPDDLSLLLWIFDALQFPQELFTGVDDGQVDAQPFRQRLVDDPALVEAHDTIVDEDSVEPVADGLMHQFCRDGRIDAARDGANNLAGRPHEVPNSLNLGVDEPFHGPILSARAQLDCKVLDQGLPAGGVRHLRVKLDPVQLLGGVRDPGEWRIGRGGYRGEPLWQRAELVAVRHPHFEFVREARE